MDKELQTYHTDKIENLIVTVRESQVMIDRDLASMYQVETRVLNQAVKRNLDRFPASFRFQLTDTEFEIWKSQTVMSNTDKMGLRRPPFVFTEQGVAMLSAVLRSDVAIKVSIQIIDAFVNMRKQLNSVSLIDHRLSVIETKQLETDKKFDDVFKALERKKLIRDEGIFFDGQIFDAYTFIADLIRSAKNEIILIDNYIDDTTLTHLSKRNKDVTATIYTQAINKQLKLDLEKHKQQYPAIEVKILKSSHDRFLLIDQKDLYLIGASLKDAGKKWFAFSKMDTLFKEVLIKLEQ